jgi:hypothetical protein
MLAQHADAVKHKHKQRLQRRVYGRGTGVISLSRPLDPAADFVPRDALKRFHDEPLPQLSGAYSQAEHNASSRTAWMKLLPSNVSNEDRTIKLPNILRRATIPQSYTSPITFPPASVQIASRYSNPRQLHPSSRLRQSPTNARKAPTRREQRISRSLPVPYSYAIAGQTEPISPSHTQVPPDHSPSAKRRRIDSSIEGEHSSSSTKPPSEVYQNEERQLGTKPTDSQSILLRQSSFEAEPSCQHAKHTPVPDQSISPAKPPFYKELSDFFSTRTGKWLLPSRVSESRDGHDTHDMSR